MLIQHLGPRLGLGGIYFTEDVNYKYLKNLVYNFDEYNPTVIELNSKESAYQYNVLIL